MSHLSNDLKQTLEKQYDIGHISHVCRLEGGWWNDVFALTTERRKYVLRVCHPSTNRELQHYVHRVERWMGQQVSEVPPPVTLRDGTTFFVYDERITCLYPFVPGEISISLGGPVREAAARMLASLHLATINFPMTQSNPRHVSLRELNWDHNHLWEWDRVRDFLEYGSKGLCPSSGFNEKQLECIEEITARRQEIEQQKQSISQWVSDLASSRRRLLFAVTHGDYYKGTLLLVDDKVTAVIDWDECKPDWLSYELARATWEFCQDGTKHMLNRQAALDFLHSYSGAGGPVPQEEFEFLIPFMRCVRLIEILSHLGEAAVRGEWDTEYTLHNLKSLNNLQNIPSFR